MNWVQLQRDWQGMTALLLSYWNKLSREDLERVDGRRDQLAACLQQAYGYGQEEAERAIAAFEKDVRYPGAVK